MTDFVRRVLRGLAFACACLALLPSCMLVNLQLSKRLAAEAVQLEHPQPEGAQEAGHAAHQAAHDRDSKRQPRGD